MIPISIPYLYKNDKQYAIKAIQDGFIGQGEYIKKFEDSFSNYCDRKYGVTCSNGTIALYLAIKALNLPKRSEVILPSMTIVSCLTAIVENDLIPVFCDVDPTTWNIDFDSVEDKITDLTSALIIVDTYGLVVDSNKLQEFKNKYSSIKIIEDASESHGGSSYNKKAGSIGDISTFSFYSNKIVTTGEGGIILTDDEEVYNRLLLLRNLNFIERIKYIHSDAGWNFRLSNLACALGYGQLENIDTTISHRKRIASRYNKYFKNHPNIQIPYEDENHNNVYWYYAIMINKNIDTIRETLVNNGIDYRHFFYPLHKQPFINSSEELKNSEYLFENGIILPTFTQLKNKDIDFICKTILNEL